MATLETTTPLPADRERLLALGAALVTVTLWASAFVGIRDAARHLSPGALALGRLTIASVALGLIVLARREPLPSRRDLGVIAFVGIFWFGIYNLALIEAEQRVDAGTAAMLVNIGPILIAVLAGLVLHEGFPPRLLGGMAIAFAGVVVIAQRDLGRRVDAELGRAPLSRRRDRVRGRRRRPEASAHARVGAPGDLARLHLRRSSSACRSQARSPASFRTHPGRRSAGWCTSPIGPMALGFLTWGYALARTTAGRMGSMTYLVPPIAILLGWLLLEETPPGLAIAGGALCLAGVVVAQRRPATAARRPD